MIPWGCNFEEDKAQTTLHSGVLVGGTVPVGIRAEKFTLKN